MPIHCPIAFPGIANEEMRSIDYAVMAQVFATHNELGRLADEAVFQRKLLLLLTAAGMEAKTEVPIELAFRDFSTSLSMDLVVDRKVIYELKTVAALLPIHESRLLSYLFLANAGHGKLINFRPASVESRFVNATLGTNERQRFELDLSNYRGDNRLSESVRELVADWGTGLNASLYRRAILRCFGLVQGTEQMLPMNSAGQQIGNQRFHLLNANTALGVTTFKEVTRDNTTALQKLLAASPIDKFHWVNITHRQVTLSTILKG